MHHVEHIPVVQSGVVFCVDVLIMRIVGDHRIPALGVTLAVLLHVDGLRERQDTR